MSIERLRLILEQFIFTLGKIRPAIDFLYKHRIWEGFWTYGWVVRVLVIAGALVSLRLVQIIYHGLQRLDISDPEAAASSIGAMFSTLSEEGYQFLFNGSMKYVVMIFMEIIIFHVCRRTIAILTKTDSEASFSAFIEAQKRMIAVVFRVYLYEMIATVLIKAAFWVLGPVDFLQPAAIFVAQCYFLGFTLLDNYHEQFGLTIKESWEKGKAFLGVSLGLGLFLQVVFYVPVAGAVAGPLIAAIMVSLVMFELTDLHQRRDPAAAPVDRRDQVV